MESKPGAFVARLRLLRFSNAPSPVADVLAGAALARAADPAAAWSVSRLVFACAASFAVYHAGMALNDFADRADDARTRPARPIPSGAVRPAEALLVGLALVAIAIAAAGAAGNLRWIAPLAAVVLIYDLALPRGTWLGPIALGGARALNLVSGAAAAASGLDVPQPVLTVAAGYGLYVTGVSLFALGEDRPWSGARAALAAAVAVGGLAVSAVALPAANAARALLWLVLVEPLSVVLGPPRPWTADRIGQLVGAGLRGTLVFDAVALASAGAPELAAACGAGYVFARVLARWIPPT